MLLSSLRLLTNRMMSRHYEFARLRKGHSTQQLEKQPYGGVDNSAQFAFAAQMPRKHVFLSQGLHWEGAQKPHI